MSIEIRNVTKTFGGYTALSDINLSVANGELVALLGPSGCGKTTLLRIIAGLLTPDCGTVYLNGADSSGCRPARRNVGFVFQHYALFHHLSVFENVAFGLAVLPGKSRPSKKAIEERVTGLLSMVQMEWSAGHRPGELSGGQRQRIALARALAVEPEFLLLDEPFSALDAKVRVELRRWLRKLHDELCITSVFVTHDQEEALELADRVVIINKGKIEQLGTPEDVYENPANAFVCDFLGNVNVFHCRIKDGKASLGGVCFDVPEIPGDKNRVVKGFTRPHEMTVSRERLDADDIESVVRNVRMTGPVVGLELESLSSPDFFDAEVSRETYKKLALKKGERVFVRLDNVRFFGADSYSI